ncbi:MAG: tRNA (adenosine(37)-N6)-dimethylallyltransferase MiaA [Firmicutes bacterium]|nr:tRNA (adenosine(37)-N6)-dimethylallyltransferase MiaA [Alicyclobacillaceae bacterium]MCL6496881.1 tRNA (adenosine(37)-N6)-dimethylallyltransferase MiaA [Bacillota bacterium]
MPLLVLSGPTAVGKTAFSLEVALRVGGEIISADSAQVYRGLDIGTAKPSPEARRAVPHHLIDVAEPWETFSVARFQALADAAIRAVWARGHLPLLVGGTGLWIRALVAAYPFAPEAADAGGTRAWLEALAQRDGWEALRRRLAIVDPASHAAILPGDHRRLVRALEVWEHGRRLPREPRPSPYRVAFWVLTRPVAELRERVWARTEAMLADGLVAEVVGLLRQGVPPRAQSLSAIGYREVVAWYFGRLADHELVPLIAKKTRQYAKRQLTWFRREPGARWLDLAAWPWEEAIAQVVADARRLTEG